MLVLWRGYGVAFAPPLFQPTGLARAVACRAGGCIIWAGRPGRASAPQHCVQANLLRAARFANRLTLTLARPVQNKVNNRRKQWVYFQK